MEPPRQLIVSHIGADFDAFASMVAARHLYPEAVLFFPGSRQATVRKLEATGALEPLGLVEVRQRQIDPAAIERIVLVDVRQRDRIGAVAEWLSRYPEIEVHVFDHHASTDEDVRATLGRIDPTVGSTATILIELLRERGITPSPLEATLLLLGLYDDTGSLTYATTHPRDLEAAAELLKQGGDLAVVRRYAAGLLDAERLDVLHALAQGLEVHRLCGHRVGIAVVDLPEYVEEVAPLVSRTVEIFELPLLFALFGMGSGGHGGSAESKVLLVARGDAPGVNLGRLLARFADGGGHRTAASGKLSGTLLEARERLIEALERELPPAARARDLMIPPSVVIPAEATIAVAKQKLLAGRVNAAPLLDSEGRAVGAVTRQLLDAALQHGLGARAATLAAEGLAWLGPEESADEAGRKMLDRHPRFLLVGDPAEGRPLGVISRMQVLRHLGAHLGDPLGKGVGGEAGLETFEAASLGANGEGGAVARRNARELAELFANRLASEDRERLDVAAALSRSQGVAVYVVGGFVRDLFLGRETRDLDLVVAGDGPRFAQELASALGARCQVHEQFLTAVVEGEGWTLDVASARSEFYRAPAALPEVAGSALRQDLFRRDFTVNAMAIQLGPEGPPTLFDPFGGRRDLAARTLRSLHSLSFLDDPTRALRGVRLERRLGFALAPETVRSIEMALGEGAFDRLSGSRMREELNLLLAEPAIAVGGLERLAELGVLGTIEPRLVLDRERRRLADGLRARLIETAAALDWARLEEPSGFAPRPSTSLLLTLAEELDRAGRERLADRLALAGEERRILVERVALLAEIRVTIDRGGVRASEVDATLAGSSDEELLLLFARSGEIGRAWIRRYLVELAPFALAIRGGDLVAAGVSPGPAIGRALGATRRARLDGHLNEGGELAFALSAAGIDRSET